ncbi:MAG: sigma-70 family RNA polymerase sigma factor [Gemmatimonadales bacterium]|nr:MAG: sigma-70 family RNA polymerase sigma factor [Gemmatimonadales bacterium]
MSTDAQGILRRLAEGDMRALDQLYPLVYDDLRRVARAQLAREHPDHTLDTTALVHESYLRFVGSTPIDAEGRAHFLSIAARAMRRILVDHARKRRAGKRGGGAIPEPLTPGLAVVDDRSLELVALDDALERLEALDERKARVVEYRVFTGMTVEETAETLGVSPATVKRDWTVARAWLNRQIRPEPGE